jgi:hypothetical protein
LSIESTKETKGTWVLKKLNKSLCYLRVSGAHTASGVTLLESRISRYRHASRRCLQRPDLHLAPLDGAPGVLKRKRPFGEFAVVGLDGDDSVENDGQFLSPGRDHEGVPLAAGLIDDGYWYRGDIDDGSGAILGVWARVPDVYLIGIGSGDILDVGAADENAAVSIGFRPELGPNLKILVGVLCHQKAVALGGTLVGHDGFTLRSPVGPADTVPVF